MPLLNLHTPSDPERETEDQSAGGLLRLLLKLQQLGSPERNLNLPPQIAASAERPQRTLGRLPILQANQGFPTSRNTQQLDSDPFDQGLTPNAQASRARPNDQEHAMGRKPTYSECVDQCLHLLPSPSGDLQSSEFRQCVGKCMGRL
jgi:hypothetical protein